MAVDGCVQPLRAGQLISGERLDLLCGTPDVGGCGVLRPVGVEPDPGPAGGVDVFDPVAFAANQRWHG